MAHTCNPSYLGGQRSGGSQFEASPGQMVHETLISKKNPSQKRAHGVAQALSAPA
jgi:hypothetical protein